MTGRGAPVAVLRTLNDDSHVETRISQYKSLENDKFEGIAKNFVIGKINGQNQVLKKYGLEPIDDSVFERINETECSNHLTFRRKLTGFEGKSTNQYYEQIFQLFDKKYRPNGRRSFKAYDGLNNILNLGYRVASWKVHIALLKAKLEPYLGYLHGLQFGKPSLVCDFLELYRYLIDNFIIDYTTKVKKSDFIIRDEVYSPNRRGKRQYLDDEMTNDFLNGLNSFFTSKVNIPRIRYGESQEVETLISEEALLLAKYLRNENTSWVPRIVSVP